MENEHKKNLPSILTNSLAVASSLTAETFEILVDQTVESGALKDIPIVGWIARLGSAYRSISDGIFLNKLGRFLTKLDSFNEGEKAEFSRRISEDPKFARKVGEKLVIAIDRIDDPEKAEILAECSSHFVSGHLSYDELNELIHVVDRSMLTDLMRLKEDRVRLYEAVNARMAASGLASFEIGELRLGGGTDINYSLSAVGRRLQRILRGEFREHVDFIRQGGAFAMFTEDMKDALELNRP